METIDLIITTQKAWITAAIAGAAALAGSIWQSSQTKKQNKRLREEQQADWEKQMEYNSPKSQMDRLKEAGLNPNLVYGNGADATIGPPPSRTSYEERTPDLTSIAGQALQFMQARANISQTEAQTAAIKASTEGQEFENKLKQKIGLDKMSDKYAIELSRLTTQEAKEFREFEVWSEIAFSGGDWKDFKVDRRGTYSTDKNTLIAKAIKAGFTQTVLGVSRAQTDLDIRKAEQIIKEFEASLTDFGISPTSLEGVTVLNGLFRAISQGAKWFQKK